MRVMAKKRRKHEEEEEFTLPEFDEKEYLRKELVGAKVMLLTVILAVAAAVISYLLTIAGIVVVAFFAGLALIFLLKYVVQGVGIDTTGYERKDWFGHGTTFFFAWLAIWVLLLNVPFADVTPPSLDVKVEGGVYDGSSASWKVNNTTTRFTVTAIATDNAGIRDVWIVNYTAARVRMNQQSGTDIWSYTLGFASGTSVASATVTAEDTSGHTVSASITIQKG